MASNTWKTDVATGNWNDSANWTLGSIPGSGDDVKIGDSTTSAAVTIPVGYTAMAALLTIGNKSTVLTVAGTLTTHDLKFNNGHSYITGNGSIDVAGTILTNGNTNGNYNQFIATGGTLFLSGAGFSGALLGIAFAINANSTLAIIGGVGTTGTVNPTVTFAAGNTSAFVDTATDQQNINIGVISGFTGDLIHSDTIQVRSFGAGINDDVLSVSGNVVTISGSGFTHSYTFESPEMAASVHLADNGNTDTLYSTFCFMAGTMIRTPDGEVAVETLKRGDLVTTTDGVAMPVSWLGKQTISTVFADPMRSFPIRVKAGALGENVPARDLLLSPDHALLVDGVMIHAGALVNDTSVVRETEVPKVFVYYHVELDDHSLILAENTPAETFVDSVDRLNFDNWAEHEALYPEGKPIVELPYPRAKGRRQVPVGIRVAIAARAEAMGLVEAIAEVA